MLTDIHQFKKVSEAKYESLRTSPLATCDTAQES